MRSSFVLTWFPGTRAEANFFAAWPRKFYVKSITLTDQSSIAIEAGLRVALTHCSQQLLGYFIDAYTGRHSPSIWPASGNSYELHRH
jgi:hypothetical protein